MAAKKKKKTNSDDLIVDGNLFASWYDNEHGMVCVALPKNKMPKKKNAKGNSGSIPSGWYLKTSGDLFLIHHDGEEVLLADAEKQFIDAGFVSSKELMKQVDQELEQLYYAKYPDREDEDSDAL